MTRTGGNTLLFQDNLRLKEKSMHIISVKYTHVDYINTHIHTQNTKEKSF